MKPTSTTRQESLLNKEFGAQSIRIVKAAQAESLLPGHDRAEGKGPAPRPRQKPEVRLVGLGTDYCDLEITCGCGEKNQIRCWNMPPAEEAKANV